MTPEVKKSVISSTIDEINNTTFSEPTDDFGVRIAVGSLETLAIGGSVMHALIKGTGPVIPAAVMLGSLILDCKMFGEKNNDPDIISIDPIDDEF